MVSGLETIPSCLLMTSSGPTKEEILARLASLEKEVEQLREENQELREENEQLRQKTSGSELKSGGTRGHIHHRARTNRITRSRPRPTGTRTTNNQELTVARLVERPDTIRNGATLLIQTKKSRSPVTAVPSVAKHSTSRRASAPDSSRNSRIHSHPKSHSTIATTTSVTSVEPRLSPHTPTAPMRGSSG
jgi:cell division septum initiation protein DivIVA